MKIEVLFFAQLKEAYGTDSSFIELPEGATVMDAADQIMGSPVLSKFKYLPLRYAVNEEFRKAETRLSDNDRLAILTPVAGG